MVGMKPAGGIRTAKQAVQNLVIVNETLGPDWLTPDRFRLGASSLLAMAAGGDFIKTSTGKLPGAATLPVTLCMLEAIRDVHEETGRMVGMKPAGGIRQAKQAVQYLVQLHETLGPEWLTPDLYRLGASSLLNDVLMQLRKEKTGAYQSPDYFTVD